MPFGGNDPKERLQLLDYEGLRKAFIYPTISLEWESEVTDLELATAYCRAYNRWVVDFCADSDWAASANRAYLFDRWAHGG